MAVVLSEVRFYEKPMHRSGGLVFGEGVVKKGDAKEETCSISVRDSDYPRGESAVSLGKVLGEKYFLEIKKIGEKTNEEETDLVSLDKTPQWKEYLKKRTAQQANLQHLINQRRPQH